MINTAELEAVALAGCYVVVLGAFVNFAGAGVDGIGLFAECAGAL